jgi:hypothetical protein
MEAAAASEDALADGGALPMASPKAERRRVEGRRFTRA